MCGLVVVVLNPLHKVPIDFTHLFHLHVVLYSIELSKVDSRLRGKSLVASRIDFDGVSIDVLAIHGLRRLYRGVGDCVMLGIRAIDNAAMTI